MAKHVEQKPDLADLTDDEKSVAEEAVKIHRAKTQMLSGETAKLLSEYQQLRDPAVLPQTKRVVRQRIETLQKMIELEKDIWNATP